MAKLRLRLSTTERTAATGFGGSIGRLIMVSSLILVVVGSCIDPQIEFESWFVFPLSMGLLGALLVTWPGSGRLTPGAATMVVICALLASSVLFGLSPQPTALWLYCYASYLLGALAGRGNFVAVVWGAALVWGAGVYWSWVREATLQEAVVLLGLPVLVVVVCVVWNLTLSGVASRDMQYRSKTEWARLAEVASEQARAYVRSELALVRQQAAPLLTQIVEGAPIDAALRLELAVAEATIRDRIRSPRLLHPHLESAVCALRRRGGTVVLIGDQRDPDFEEQDRQYGSDETIPARIGDALAAAVAERLSALGRESSVTIRLLAHPGEAELSLLMREANHITRLHLSGAGLVLSQQ